MTAQILTKLTKNAWFAIIASVTIVMLSFVSFIMAEPQISHSQDATREFTISQTITGEATFLVDPTNVTMDGNINGITGGSATGTTQFVVQSNSTGGHYVEINFGAAANTYPGQFAMVGDLTGDEGIYDYNYGTASSGEPTANFWASSTAQFGYHVISTTTSDTDVSFRSDGSTCNTAGSWVQDTCWATPSSTAFRIVDRSTPAPDGATTTIKFKVDVPSGASPVPAAETFTATATLSLYSQ